MDETKLKRVGKSRHRPTIYVDEKGIIFLKLEEKYYQRIQDLKE